MALHPETADARAGSAAVELASAGARLQRFLGLPAEVFDAGVIPGSDLTEGATSGHMLNAIWNATLGYTLRYFWNPISTAQSLLDDAAIAELRAWAVRYVRPGRPALGAARRQPAVRHPADHREGPCRRDQRAARAGAGEDRRLVPLGLGCGEQQGAQPLRPERREPAPGAGDAAVADGQALVGRRRPGGDRQLSRHRDLHRRPASRARGPARRPARRPAAGQQGALHRALAASARSRTRSMRCRGCNAILPSPPSSSTATCRSRATSSRRCASC